MRTLLALPLTILSMAQAQTCPKEGTSAGEAISFLEESKFDAHANYVCVIGAIRNLEYVHTRKAADVLVEYLDYRRPADEVVTGSSMEPYPAISALFGVGKPALPPLVRVVAISYRSKTARDNAVKTIM